MNPKANETFPRSLFLDFIEEQPVLVDAVAATTDIVWDLDGTMFRAHTEQGKLPDGPLSGTWRPDMPTALQALQQRGFTQHILSSATPEYIQEALAIYKVQFGEDPNTFFQSACTTRRENSPTQDVVDEKMEACYEFAEQAEQKGRRAVFIDDTGLPFSGE